VWPIVTSWSCTSHVGHSISLPLAIRLSQSTQSFHGALLNSASSNRCWSSWHSGGNGWSASIAGYLAKEHDGHEISRLHYTIVSRGIHSCIPRVYSRLWYNLLRRCVHWPYVTSQCRPTGCREMRNLPVLCITVNTEVWWKSALQNHVDLFGRHYLYYSRLDISTMLRHFML